LEWLIMTLGAKACCIGASGVGGLANWATNKKISWRDLGLAILVGWAAAEFLIPPIMKQWQLDVMWGPVMAFFIGYSGLRMLPRIEDIVAERFKKGK